ncbi:hypothetical protein [Zavarzinia aquatilis]|nr:hypothetical protein [Zavarzinia aquatilis]
MATCPILRRAILPVLVLVPVLALLGAWLAETLADDGGARREIAGITYRVPAAFHVRPQEGNALFIQLSLPDWGPLDEDRPGWDDNVNILIEEGINSIPQLWDDLWSAVPGENIGGIRERVTRIYRIEPNLTVKEISLGRDIVIPDQDLTTFPIGIMRCWRPQPDLPNASCALLFDRDGQRWKVTFGRDRMRDFSIFKQQAAQTIDLFREK